MRISKKAWINAYLKLDDDDPIIQCFKKLGEFPILHELITGELPAKLKPLELLLANAMVETAQMLQGKKFH